ncbi:hypothetical protein ACLOJK_019560 [Asimina triloba]
MTIGVLALRLCTLAYEFCYRRQQEEEEEHQEFKLAEEDAEDITISSLATTAAQGVLGSSSSCIVCLEEFREGDLCRRLRCRHVFQSLLHTVVVELGKKQDMPLVQDEILTTRRRRRA